MYSKKFAPYIWFPLTGDETQHQWKLREQWLYANMPETKAKEWSDFLHDKNFRFTEKDVLKKILMEDAAPFIRLLFPSMSKLFLDHVEYELSHPEIFDLLKVSPEERKTIEEDLFPWSSQRLNLNATAFCALIGAAECLQALLELGADPNGLDSLQSRNTLSIFCTKSDQPVTPLDCAVLAKRTKCQQLLRSFGGKTTPELVGLENE